MLTPEMPKKALKEYHSLFYALSQLGDPVWDTRIKTANVNYNSKTGTLVWRFNPKFYESLNDNEKAFVVAHEALHLISDHSNRIREAIYGNRKERPSQADLDRDRKQADAYNVSADIVVNESLKRIYGFDLETMPNLRNNLIDYDYVKRIVSPDVLKAVLAKHTNSDTFLMGLDEKGDQNVVQNSEKTEVEDFNEEDMLTTSSMEFFVDVLKSGQVSTSRNKNQFKLNPPDQSGESSSDGEPNEKGSNQNKGGKPDEHAPEAEEESDDVDDSANPSEESDAESTDGDELDSLDNLDTNSEQDAVPTPDIDDPFGDSEDIDDLEVTDDSELDDSGTEESEDYQPSEIGMDYDPEENNELEDQDDLEEPEDLEDQNETDLEESDNLERDIDFDDLDDTEEHADSSDSDLSSRETLDEHSWNNEQQPSLSEIAQALNDQIQDMDLSQSDKSEILEELGEVCKEAGTDLGSAFSVVRPKYRPKPKWETIIKKWISNTLEEFAFTDDNWFGDKKQFQWLNAALESTSAKKKSNTADDVALAVLGSELMLPGEERDSPDIHKIPVVLFLDTSGSCINYAQRFIDAARTFPTDRFDVTVYGFTTHVYDIDITKPRPKLYSGGTSFRILEKKLLELPKYPKVVFVITDGWGDRFMPKFPDRWYWFFSDLGYVRDSSGVYDTTKPIYPDYVKNLIGKCKFFDLANFE